MTEMERRCPGSSCIPVQNMRLEDYRQTQISTQSSNTLIIQDSHNLPEKPDLVQYQENQLSLRDNTLGIRNLDQMMPDLISKNADHR